MYNIRYGTGSQWKGPFGGYFGHTSDQLHEIIEFIRPLDPDIIGLVEVDAGSYRSKRRNQAEAIARELGHYHSYRSKYSQTSFWQRVPVINKQGNAFLSRDSITNERFHYFQKGMKRLVIELETERLTIFLVHLALSAKIRHHQLGDLYSLVKGTRKPHIVAGDFNALWGEHEIKLFLAATGLVNANGRRLPTYPSWEPKRHLDFILHSPDIRMNRFWVPDIQLSDHLPLVLDFDLPAQ